MTVIRLLNALFLLLMGYLLVPVTPWAAFFGNILAGMLFLTVILDLLNI